MHAITEKYSCVETEDLAELLAETVRNTEKGTLSVDGATDKSSKWDRLNSVFFAATVITTIGMHKHLCKTAYIAMCTVILLFFCIFL